MERLRHHVKVLPLSIFVHLNSLKRKNSPHGGIATPSESLTLVYFCSSKLSQAQELTAWRHAEQDPAAPVRSVNLGFLCLFLWPSSTMGSPAAPVSAIFQLLVSHTLMAKGFFFLFFRFIVKKKKKTFPLSLISEDRKISKSTWNMKGRRWAWIGW